MKRIKLFENFDLEKLKSGIDDVLVELKDNGFNVRKIASQDYISIHIIKTGYKFEFNDIEEYVIMLVDYINTYLPKYKDNIKFIGYDEDLDKVFEVDSIDVINTRLAWDEAEGKPYKLKTLKVCFGDSKFTKVIAESYIDDMIVSDDELRRMWNNIEDIFVELKDDRYNISITSYNSITGLDVTIRTPKFKSSVGSYYECFKYETIIDYINTFEDFMIDYYKNDEVTFNYTYNDGYSRIDSSNILSKDILNKYHITNIVVTVQKNNEKIIQRQKDKYKYLTESNWNSDVYKIENDLSDMFVELFDVGYDVLIGHHQDTLTLSIRRDDKQKFNTADVREYLLMAEEYFRDLNKDIKIIYDGIGTTGRVPKNKLIKSIQMIVWN